MGTTYQKKIPSVKPGFSPNGKAVDQAPSVALDKKWLLGISFFEGAAVMVIELLGAKIVAPFYGTSLYVWASVLGVTLMALALGYYTGGWVSKQYRNEHALFLVIGIGAVFTLIAPLLAPKIMLATSDLGVRAGSFVSVLLYLLPPVVCMGMVSPMITQLINSDASKAGMSAGTVYAVSTVGGILATFSSGFYLIPELGINLTASLTSGLLAIIALAGLISRRKIWSGTTLMGLCVLLFALMAFKNAPTSAPGTRVQYQSSGILGNWMVVDQVAAVQNGEELYTRQLLLNGVDQTYTEVGNEPVSMWSYPHQIAALAGIKPVGSKALLLGMGGGSIAHNLRLLGFKLDIVELDERIPYISKKYFGFDPTKANLFLDDARHFVRNSTDKYDVVVMDMVNGEVQPSHVFTQEGLGELRKVLNDDALVIINFQGRFDLEIPEQSRGPRSVFKTFESIGYKMFVVKRAPEEAKDVSADLLMYGTPGQLNFDSLFRQEFRYNAIFPFDHYSGERYAPAKEIDLSDAVVLTDDKPILELLNTPTILAWRRNKMKYAIEGLLKKGIQLYK